MLPNILLNLYTSVFLRRTQSWKTNKQSNKQQLQKLIMINNNNRMYKIPISSKLQLHRKDTLNSPQT